MAKATSDRAVTARIVFWGAEGAGKTTSLHAIHGKLKADHRGDLKRIPTRLDPTVTYEEFTIQLGSLNGAPTELRVFAVPGSPELASTRKQLLDQVDGLVLVLDSRADRLEDNLNAIAELRTSLAAYGRTLEEIPVVVQYNKRDLGDPYAIEEMHRRLALPEAAVFETVATDSTGILQALTTISKRVVRVLRESNRAPAPAQPAPPVAAAQPAPAAPAPAAPAPGRAAMEEAILAEPARGGAEVDRTMMETQAALDQPWPEVSQELKAGAGARIGEDMRVLSVGTASRAGHRGVRLPIVLGNDEGETVTLALTIQLDPLLDDEST
jgi:signal recognition particle receptor subunit beta